MERLRIVVFIVCLLQVVLAVKVRVVMHSEQDDSKFEDEDVSHTESWDHKKRVDVPILPYLKAHKHTVATEERDKVEYIDEEKITTVLPKQQHPNDMLFPLIYRQSHINSMFKFGDNWYTWSTEKRGDGSKAINYYICYDEPKHCDDVGWERTDALPKCAFQIDSLLPEDRVCINSFGTEPRTAGTCDGGEQMKMNEVIRACGPRIRSLWRFVRVGRRPANVAKPADVNSLVCEDEEECFLSIEYRIHHDRITFSLHEPARGQTYKSVLKRESPTEEEKLAVPTEPRIASRVHKNKKNLTRGDEDKKRANKKILRHKVKAEGKGITKDHNDSDTYERSRRVIKNKIKPREDVSDDTSE